jgi:hypothetical protein
LISGLVASSCVAATVARKLELKPPGILATLGQIWRHREWPGGGSSWITAVCLTAALSPSLMQEQPCSRPHLPPSLPLLDASYLPASNPIPCRTPSALSTSAIFILSPRFATLESRLLHLAAGRGMEDRTMEMAPGTSLMAFLSRFCPVSFCRPLHRASLLICRFLLASSHFHDSVHLGSAYSLFFPPSVAL